ncbi:hypothetical protein Taro_034876 [Colocasia esculenta]|uniref:Uncharacterized protein n=1 Tax=Colocasia esculenta TaxID=4460 RepID=A0A843VSP8_COLES|nr:hypothetical protein [Colocasia esculenta]
MEAVCGGWRLGELEAGSLCAVVELGSAAHPACVAVAIVLAGSPVRSRSGYGEGVERLKRLGKRSVVRSSCARQPCEAPWCVMGWYVRIWKQRRLGAYKGTPRSSEPGGIESQIADVCHRRESGQLPSQAIANPRNNLPGFYQNQQYHQAQGYRPPPAQPNVPPSPNPQQAFVQNIPAPQSQNQLIQQDHPPAQARGPQVENVKIVSTLRSGKIRTNPHPHMSTLNEDKENEIEKEIEEQIEENVEKEKSKEKEKMTEEPRYGTWRMEWEGFHLRRPRVYADRDRLPVHAGHLADRDHLPVHAGRPADRDCLPVLAGHPADRDRLPVHAGRPADRDCLPDPASSVTFPIQITTRGKIDPGSASRYNTTLVYAHILGPVDSWKEFPPSVWELLFDMFTVHVHETGGSPSSTSVWESTSQTNLRKSMWEARDKATKTTGSRDPTAWMDYGPRHELERAPTFRELFDQTHKQKGTNDYVSESARTIAVGRSNH